MRHTTRIHMKCSSFHTLWPIPVRENSHTNYPDKLLLSMWHNVLSSSRLRVHICFRTETIRLKISVRLMSHLWCLLRSIRLWPSRLLRRDECCRFSRFPVCLCIGSHRVLQFYHRFSCNRSPCEPVSLLHIVCRTEMGILVKLEG